MTTAIAYLLGLAATLAAAAGVYFVWARSRTRATTEAPAGRSVEINREALLITGSSVTEDELLRAEFDSLKKLPPSDRDEALEKLARSAAEVGDWWLAMDVAEVVSTNLGKDKTLKAISESAIRNKEWCIAALAVDRMFYKNFQEQAKQHLADEAGRGAADPPGTGG